MTAGSTSPAPRATARMALTRASGLTSLKRKPLARIRSAPKTYSSSSNVVRIRTGADPRLRRIRRRGFDAVHRRQTDVHQHDVGPGAARGLRAPPAIAGLADDGEVGLVVDDHPQPGPDHRLIVDRRRATGRCRRPSRWHQSPRSGGPGASHRAARRPMSELKVSAAADRSLPHPEQPWPRRRLRCCRVGHVPSSSMSRITAPSSDRRRRRPGGRGRDEGCW